MNRADALVVVSPEYNHGYSGLLKHVLDGCLKEYIHQAVGVVGVSAGPFGGTRGIQDLLPVLRELGLVSIFWDVNFSNVQSLFDLGVMHVDGSEPDDLPELWRRDESPCGEVGPSDRPGRRGVHGPGAGRDGRGAAHLSGMRDVRLAASEQWR